MASGYNEDKKEGTGNVKLTSVECGVAGGISGFITRALLQPLDVLKIRFQLQVEPTFGKHGGLYNGILQALKKIYIQEGVFGLWRGHIPAQVLTVTYSSGQFWSYSYMKQRARTFGYGDDGYVQAACGGFAGLVGTLVSMPFDVARTRLVAQSIPEYSGLTDVCHKLLVHEGVTSLWKGLTPTLCMTVPFAAIQFHMYYFLSSVFPSEKTFQEFGVASHLVNTVKSAACGATAGVFAKLIVYPFDVLKKRMQIRGSEQVRKNFGKVVVYRNMSDCIKKLTKEEGVLGWYKGVWPSLIKSAMFSGLVFTFYELSCDIITHTHIYNEDRR